MSSITLQKNKDTKFYVFTDETPYVELLLEKCYVVSKVSGGNTIVTDPDGVSIPYPNDLVWLDPMDFCGATLFAIAYGYQGISPLTGEKFCKENFKFFDNISNLMFVHTESDDATFGYFELPEWAPGKAKLSINCDTIMPVNSNNTLNREFNMMRLSGIEKNGSWDWDMPNFNIGGYSFGNFSNSPALKSLVKYFADNSKFTSVAGAMHKIDSVSNADKVTLKSTFDTLATAYAAQESTLTINGSNWIVE